MYWWVSAAVRQHIVENFSVDPATIDDSIEGAARERFDGEVDGVESRSEAENVVDEIAARNKLTEEFLITSLRDGEIPLFEASLARAVGIRVKLMRRLLYEPGGEGLAMACKAVGFACETLATIFRLTREANAANGPFDSRELDALIDFFNCLKQKNAESVVARWRRDPEFLHAMKKMDAAS
jgi:uncharacterized protein (DUF2336 family)